MADARKIDPSTLDDIPEAGEVSRVRTRTGAPASDATEGLLSRSSFLALADSVRNPWARQIEAAAGEVARRVGLLTETNQARFDAFNPFASHAYPDASLERGVACTVWCNWLFFFDDHYDDDRATSGNLDRVRERMEHNLGLLTGASTPCDLGPLERLTLDFRSRALSLASPAWLSRFATEVEAYLFNGVIPAIENWHLGRTPPLEEYLEHREFDAGCLMGVDLIEIASGIFIPDEVRNSLQMVRARRACARTVGLFNDIVSYPKEVIRHKNPNNLVHVLMVEQGLSLRHALHEALEIVNDAAYELMMLENRILADPPPNAGFTRTYLKGMKAFQRGNMEFSLGEERYASRWSPVAELLRPDLNR